MQSTPTQEQRIVLRSLQTSDPNLKFPQVHSRAYYNARHGDGQTKTRPTAKYVGGDDAETMGRPGLPPGIYFRLLLIGYFEGIDSERGIAWRAADSFALRDFLGVGLEGAPPDHSTISRTRRLIDLETHRAVFT